MGLIKVDYDVGYYRYIKLASHFKEFGSSFNLPNYYARNQSNARALGTELLHLYIHSGRVSTDDLEERLWKDFGFSELREKCDCCRERVSKKDVAISGRYSIVETEKERGIFGTVRHDRCRAVQLCHRCDRLLMEAEKWKNPKNTLVYAFATEAAPPAVIAWVFEIMFQERISKYIGRYAKPRGIYVTQAEWVWRLFNQWGMLEQKPTPVLED